MNIPPAFQFYVGDWLKSQRVALMTLEQEGAYIRLLCYCWQFGSIPSDPEKLAFLIGKGASTTLATTLKPMFELDLNDPTKMLHERLNKEREKQLAWREKSSKGGKKSAKNKHKSKQKQKDTVSQPPLQPPLQANGNTSVFSLQSSDCNLQSFKKEKIDYPFFKNYWNEKLTPQILELNDERKAKIKTRCSKDTKFKERFMQAIDIIPKTPFLQGENNRGWKPDFDWLIINDTNYLKVIEGKYKPESKHSKERPISTWSPPDD